METTHYGRVVITKMMITTKNGNLCAQSCVVYHTTCVLFSKICLNELYSALRDLAHSSKGTSHRLQCLKYPLYICIGAHCRGGGGGPVVVVGGVEWSKLKIVPAIAWQFIYIRQSFPTNKVDPGENMYKSDKNLT